VVLAWDRVSPRVSFGERGQFLFSLIKQVRDLAVAAVHQLMVAIKALRDHAGVAHFVQRGDIQVAHEGHQNAALVLIQLQVWRQLLPPTDVQRQTFPAGRPSLVQVIEPKID
jgi:hypothetical protein